MPYTEGAHDSPADTKDRLVRIGTKYQATAPSVADGDNVYLLVDSAGRLLITGGIPHDAVDLGADNPIKIGGIHKTLLDPVSGGDRVDGAFDSEGRFVVSNGSLFTAVDGYSNASFFQYQVDQTTKVALALSGLLLKGPDGAWDRIGGAGDSGPGLGAMNVAPIGGDLTLRASAAISEASGTSTAVDNLGWVKGFTAHLDVTQTRNGTTAKLDVYLQTQLASGDWQDIAHFTQVGVSVTAEIVDWGPGNGNISGIGVEASAVTFDRFFSEQDAGMSAANIRVMNLGDSMRVKWVYTAGDSSADDYTFALLMTPHS